MFITVKDLKFLCTLIYEHLRAVGSLLILAILKWQFY